MMILISKLLNACVSNCNRLFKLEVSSREFIDLLRQIVIQRVSFIERLYEVIEYLTLFLLRKFLN